MANVQRSNRCKVCDGLIPVKRLRRHPCAVLCGAAACGIEHKRRRRNRAQHNWLNKKVARDPAWRLSEARKATARYQRRKSAAARSPVDLPMLPMLPPVDEPPVLVPFDLRAFRSVWLKPGP